MAQTPELEQATALLAALADVDDAQGTIEGMRRAFERVMDRLPVPQPIDCRRVNAGGVPAEWIAAPESDAARAALYLHGGGYIIGSVRTHRGLMAGLSASAGARVLGLEYRLAPEHPFPAAVEDAVAAYHWLLQQGYAPERLAIAGDSAGGGLAVAAGVAARYLGLPLPAALVCFSPWTDFEGLGESMTAKAEVDPLVGRDNLEVFGGLYLNGRDRRAPLAAPLYADLRGLPPMLVQVGECETLLDDSTRLAAAAKDAGVPVELDIWPDMIHVWQLFAPILPEGRQALEQAGEFIRRHTAA